VLEEALVLGDEYGFDQVRRDLRERDQTPARAVGSVDLGDQLRGELRALQRASPSVGDAPDARAAVQLEHDAARSARLVGRRRVGRRRG
jgi:hypothetical protein